MATKAKKTTKKAAEKKPAKKAAKKKTAAKSELSAAKLAKQLEKIEKQVAAGKKERTELKKQGRDAAKLTKALEKTRDELENFRDWTRQYFEEVTGQFDGLAKEQKKQAKVLGRLAELESRLDGAPAPKGGKSGAGVSARELARLKEELEEIRRWVTGVRDELRDTMNEVRDEARSARTGLDDLVQRNWQPVGWQELPPGVL